MRTEYQYIRFERFYNKRKITSSWFCRNKGRNHIIGEVRWQFSWRQYCFFPARETLYSAGCLKDIQEFIGQLTEERKR